MLFISIFQGFSASSIELKHLCLEYMTPWLLNLAKFCKHPADETKRHKVAHILDKLITLTIEEVEMYPSIQAKIWGNIGRAHDMFSRIFSNRNLRNFFTKYYEIFVLIFVRLISYLTRIEVRNCRRTLFTIFKLEISYREIQIENSQSLPKKANKSFLL